MVSLTMNYNASIRLHAVAAARSFRDTAMCFSNLVSLQPSGTGQNFFSLLYSSEPVPYAEMTSSYTALADASSAPSTHLYARE